MSIEVVHRLETPLQTYGLCYQIPHMPRNKITDIRFVIAPIVVHNGCFDVPTKTKCVDRNAGVTDI